MPADPPAGLPAQQHAASADLPNVSAVPQADNIPPGRGCCPGVDAACKPDSAARPSPLANRGYARSRIPRQQRWPSRFIPVGRESD